MEAPRNPDALIKYLVSQGFDATRGATQLGVVPGGNVPMMHRIIYVPAWMPDGAIQTWTAAVKRWLSEDSSESMDLDDFDDDADDDVFDDFNDDTSSVLASKFNAKTYIRA